MDEFLSALRLWAQKIRAGELSARVPVPGQVDISELSQDINFVAEMLESLSRDAEIQLQRHTEHIARKNEETNALSIMRERTNIANELHDSLAQTLASVKYQVRVLDETIHQGDEAATWQELERIESTIDEAHTELRALIAYFRLPIGEHSLLVPAEQMVERFKQDCDGIHIYLQKEWPDTTLPPQIEFQVLRIIQEALTNSRKHSEASAIRVLMRGDDRGHYTVLIEDDGIGISEQQRQNTAGEHVGISVMQDRASRIGGTLVIEGEPSEGVQVRLEFDYVPDTPRDTQQ
jgi:two-component system nitrate/nitrite sensor histidine kinase NarX